MVGWPGRLVPDRSLRTLDGGRVLVGGSPLTMLRFARRLDLGGPLAAATTALLIDRGMVHPAPSTGSMTAADVTIVIPVFQGAQQLRRTLAALSRRGDAVARIVVVDDASADVAATGDVVRAANLEIPNGASGPVITLRERTRNGGAGAARNEGLANTETPLVAFLDAGCEPRAGWLEPLLAHFGDPLVAVVAPRIIGSDAPPPQTLLARYEAVRSPLDQGDEPARVVPRSRVSYVPSACIVARVDALRGVGGFDASLRVGEDVDLVWRLIEAEASWRVRYEPASRVTHDHRVTLRAWAARRVDYGTSAAPLELRHPRSVAPVAVSPWSAAVWLLAAAGKPAPALGVGVVSTALLARKLRRLPHPAVEAVRLAGRGNIGAGRLLGSATRRTWWPVAGAAVCASKRARRTVVAAFVLPPLIEWIRERPPLDPVSWVALRAADDVAYGTGVWLGCIRQRTIGPLLPSLHAGHFNPV